MSSKKPKMSKDKSIETLKRVLDYIAAYRWAVCLSLLLALVTVAFTLYIPILTGKAVDEIVSQGNVDFSALISIIKKIIMAMAATAISQWLMNHINNIITYRVVKDIRTKAFGHLEVLPLSYIDSHPSGDIISRIIADIDLFCCDFLEYSNYLKSMHLFPLIPEMASNQKNPMPFPSIHKYSFQSPSTLSFISITYSYTTLSTNDTQSI